MRKLMIWFLVALMALSGFAFAEAAGTSTAINGSDAVRIGTDVYFAIPDGARQMLVRVPLGGGDPICVDRGDSFEDLLAYGGGVVYLKSDSGSSAIMSCNGAALSTVYAFGISRASDLSYYGGRLLVLIDGLLHSIEPDTQLCLRLSSTEMQDYVLGGNKAYFLAAGDRMEYTATLESGETVSAQAGCVYSLDLNTGAAEQLLDNGGADLKIRGSFLYFHNLAEPYAVRTADNAQLRGRVYSLDVQMLTAESQCDAADNDFWPLERGTVVWYTGGALNIETSAGLLALYTPESNATVTSDGDNLYVWEPGRKTVTQVQTNGTVQEIYAGDLTQAVDLSLAIPEVTPEPDSDEDPNGNADWFKDYVDGGSGGGGSGSGAWPAATPIGTTPTPIPVATPTPWSDGSGGSGGGSSGGGTYSVNISYLKITGGTVNVRSGAGTNHSVKFTLSKGTVVQCTGTAAKDSSGYTWYQIKHNGSTGWVSAGYASKTSAPDANYVGPEESMSGKTVVITGASVHVRAKPNLNGSELGVVKEGAKLSFQGKKSTDSRGVDWYKVSYNGKTGWVSSKYSKVSKSGSGGSGGGDDSATGTEVKATGDLTIRSSANKDSEVMGYMKKGAVAVYEGTSKYDNRKPAVLWYKVTYKGITGWVSSKYAKLQ